jgi:hypothetical protein
VVRDEKTPPYKAVLKSIRIRLPFKKDSHQAIQKANKMKYTTHIQPHQPKNYNLKLQGELLFLLWNWQKFTER